VLLLLWRSQILQPGNIDIPGHSGPRYRLSGTKSGSEPASAVGDDRYRNRRSDRRFPVTAKL
jgi:hypothetical protein